MPFRKLKRVTNEPFMTLKNKVTENEKKKTIDDGAFNEMSISLAIQLSVFN